jgi:copper/silver efflux system protein
VSRFLIRLYEPFVYVALRRPKSTIAIGLCALASAVPLAMTLGHEFMPPLNEGDLLYMPITFPNISIAEAERQLQAQDRILKTFPEVESVFGKVGRAETATDPAPLTMVEATVRLRPQAEWRKTFRARWYSSWAPAWLKPALGVAWPESQRLTWDELTHDMNQKMQFPGWTNAWTMPIKTRVDMLTTGVRTPIGIKVFGTDLDQIEAIGVTLERVIAPVKGTRSVLYERNLGGLYVDIIPRPEALGRYGLRVADVESVVETAIGGVPIGTTIEGRNRFTINVRYPRDLRGDLDALRRVLVPIGGASERAVVPLGDVADVRIAGGPPMVRDEAGLLVGYVYVDIDQGQRDLGGYVDDAKAAVARALGDGTLKLPAGTYLKWTGQYEQLEQMAARMKLVVPLTLLIIVLLLYLQFRDVIEVLIILLSIPFALVGSVWLLWLLDYRVSTAVWVGIIALVGLAAQTGIVMIVYIDNAFRKRQAEGRINALRDIIAAHMEGTVQRVRPKLMTVSTMLIGLVPLLWATSSGADVMKRIAAPMVGGLLTSAFLTLEIIPVVVTYWRQEQLLWQRLAALAPARLRSLRWSSSVLAAGAALAASVAVAPVYVTLPGKLFALGQVVAAAAFMGGVASYVFKRRAAYAVVWPAKERDPLTKY